jgi:hypothetical protein
MTRDRQIFVRTTQEAYDWVAAQADALGVKHGALVSDLLEMAARHGWVLERPGIAVTGAPGSAPSLAAQRSAGGGASPAPAGSPAPQRTAREDVKAERARLDACTHPGVARKARCPRCRRYNV